MAESKSNVEEPIEESMEEDVEDNEMPTLNESDDAADKNTSDLDNPHEEDVEESDEIDQGEHDETDEHQSTDETKIAQVDDEVEDEHEDMEQVEEEEETEANTGDESANVPVEEVEDEEEETEEGTNPGAPLLDESVDEEEEDEEEDETQTAESNNNNDDESHHDQGNSESMNVRKRSASVSDESGPMKRQRGSTDSPGHDSYCWVCHKEGIQVHCKICPRSYHLKCRHLPDEPAPKGPAAELAPKSYICPECAVVMNAENLETRSEAMKQLTVDQLITMLKLACQRMKNFPGVEPFLYPVDPSEAADYLNYIVYPMDLHTLEKNVKQRQYGSTEAFLADAQWLVHNSIVFNSASSPFTAIAKKILKVCKQEIQEIETCPECYVNAHNRPECWFIEACKRPHILVWAKLKGFPFWPAKAMKIRDESVDVRFFGQHDRAWVCRKDCYLYSEEMPGSAPKRNNHLNNAIEELNAHIEKLKERNGPFIFATPKTQIGPLLSVEQIRKMLPEFKVEDEQQKTKPSLIVQAPKGKSPMTIRISSLKTNPTIVNNSLTDDESIPGNLKPLVRIKSKRTLAASTAEASTAESSSDETKKEDEQKTTLEDIEEVESKILANALGENRSTRRTSSSSGNELNQNGEKRLTRSQIKSVSEEEDEGGDTVSGNPDIPPPPDSFLQSIGLRKASDAKLPNQSIVKEEPEDNEDDNEHSIVNRRPGGTLGTKAQEFINLPVSQSGSGMRYSLSKDISISAVDDGQTNKGEVRMKKSMISGSNTSSRLPPGSIPQMGGNRPRLSSGSNGAMGGRMMQQNRPLTRPMRPGTPMRQGMRMPGQRPQQQQPMRGPRPKDPSIMDSSSLRMDGQGFNTSNSNSSSVQLSQVQSIQGAITLPGGTITVTPLAPIIYGNSGETGTLNGGNSVVIKHNQVIQSSGTNGLPISVLSPHESSHQSNSQKSNAIKLGHPRRNLINQIPTSVGHLVQNLQKTLVEAVKTSMEQIVVEMVENAPNTSSTEVKAIKDENEKLKKQLLDAKHNSDIAIREVKLAMENDKKRALNDLRRQSETDKMKLMDEIKKKQWCARCGREAQFYCCWNTSYCGYQCQEDHWPNHMGSCAQGK